MGDITNVILIAAMVIVAVVVVFLILREVFCWYWKINEIVKNQKETNRLLSEMLTVEQKQPIIEPTPDASPTA